MIVGCGGRPIENSPGKLNWNRKSRSKGKSTWPTIWRNGYFVHIFCSHARQEAEKALAVKVSSGSNSKIIVPGTPRHPGLTGNRVGQTPRRRVGIWWIYSFMGCLRVSFYQYCCHLLCSEINMCVQLWFVAQEGWQSFYAQ
jgi:hypothetical protein